MKAFILISLSEGSEQVVLNELKAMPEVVNAYILFGEWDVLAEVELSGVEELGSFVMEKVRSREDIKLTSTLVVAGK